ncbi:glutamine--fructose-6-phosphate transaminase (isomerizing) [Turicimonas muris]|uniref:Glutamine--fructose-6-phosphate aminotransferase [isomerizing] n=10 Tax=Turicimonas muris TaxID=1796652 RepID=A0A227KR14_9BURK|nr:glutamine--fructose-6-phosphate transaminase (isomerizing) [Turicimonas muris]ANU66837.1 glutamine--fructose-6-phosphate aminotransferase [Burkholderiales bacterium YL45]OXE50126.1 glutamine--fructose-6-phosphate aminotransferase [Turicimonas muris]QQQ95704.1 glutamine--fructose-6-phosphate transaminase (isomerizing) [Turicimonas muris]
MCGIVAASSKRDVVPILTEGLRRLEYRGYDSCGIAIVDESKLKRTRTVKRVNALIEQTKIENLSGLTGIAHTRWATHGAPEICNTHPHFSHNMMAVVHNGIIENYEEIREELIEKGYEFLSQTDTEVIVHLVHSLYEGDLLKAVEKAVQRLRGAYAIALTCIKEPNRVVATKKAAPLVAALGEGENFVASDPIALAGVTDKFIYLEDGDVVDVTPEKVVIWHKEGEEYKTIERPVSIIHEFSSEISLGNYNHYMQKEIFEQPRAIADTLEGVQGITGAIFGFEAPEMFKRLKRVLIIACGTSYYAGMIGKYWIESIAKVPVDVEIASEYRYRESVPDLDTLVLTISQSGETADTLAALRHAQDLGMDMTMTICNVATSAMVKETKAHYITRAGVEIGVASTKAFTTQLAALYLLALAICKEKGRLTPEREEQAIRELRHLPKSMDVVLKQEPEIKTWAELFADKNNALFLGRGAHYPIALEGALKLKEISYIHAEGYPAGELKHGPLALVDGNMPVVTVAPNDELIEKLKSNMQEVRARKGVLFVFSDADSNIEPSDGIHVIKLPENYGDLSPILHVLPLQLLAYHTALVRGTDVDKPRNLAKSVTVE